jgi:hypothetical protein
MDSSEQDNSLAEFPPELDELRRINREHVISRLADWTKEAGAPEGHSREVMNGAPLDVLLQESRSRNADLLVLGITGDSLLPYGAGTLATKCLRKTATKVLLVKQTHPQPFRRIVACVDFSETSKEVVKHALREAVIQAGHSEQHRATPVASAPGNKEPEAIYPPILSRL